MNASWRTILAAISMLSLMAAAPAARADVSGESNGSGDLTMTVGSLTAVFKAGEPQIRFFVPSGMGQVEHEVEFERIFEFRDSSGDAVFQGSEILTKADLENAKWTSQGFQPILDGNGQQIGLGIDLVLDASSLKIETASNGNVIPSPNLVMVLKVKAFETPQTLTSPDGRTFDVSSAEVKVDIVIETWPFTATGSMLALQIDLDSEVEQFEVEDGDGVVSVDGSHAEGTSVAEHKFDGDPHDVEEEVRITPGLLTTSSTVGFFRFVDTAMITDSSGARSVPVTASFKVETEDNETEFELFLAYPQFTGRLEHDPSFGITGGGLPTLLLVVAGASVAGLATVLVIRRRHPRINHDSQKVSEAGAGSPVSTLPSF